VVALGPVQGVQEQGEPRPVAIRRHAHPSVVAARRAPFDPARGGVGVKGRFAMLLASLVFERRPLRGRPRWGARPSSGARSAGGSSRRRSRQTRRPVRRRRARCARAAPRLLSAKDAASRLPPQPGRLKATSSHPAAFRGLSAPWRMTIASSAVGRQDIDGHPPRRTTDTLGRCRLPNEHEDGIRYAP
jgi:hypothetical protein